MDVQPQLKTFVLFTHCLAPPPVVQQEEKIKMVELITMGTVSLDNIITSALCVQNWKSSFI